ncbi:hypothetical protein ACFQ1S_10305 [Kibdelosporangium lantanae]|uniref:Uncharacterized protein n=1 Tax=Kibdelosporangium lantanae TaxID=1497396 RepID=A0ABW3M6J1_9PSEU
MNAITTKEIRSRRYRRTTADDTVTVLDLLGWLAYRLPAADPIRDRLPEVLDEVRAKVTAPGVRFSMSTCCEPEKLTQLLAVPQDEKVVVDDVLELHRDTYWGDNFYYQTYLHPGKYAPKHRDMLNAVMELSESEEFDLTTLLRFQDEDFADVCAQKADTGYLQDPTVTVPDLVAEAAGKYDVDEDVAVLYLQILALNDPTDANVARWLAWKPARLRKARAALAGTDLVITAKRSRAEKADAVLVAAVE